LQTAAVTIIEVASDDTSIADIASSSSAVVVVNTMVVVAAASAGDVVFVAVELVVPCVFSVMVNEDVAARCVFGKTVAPDGLIAVGAVVVDVVIEVVVDEESLGTIFLVLPFLPGLFGVAKGGGLPSLSNSHAAPHTKHVTVSSGAKRLSA